MKIIAPTLILLLLGSSSGRVNVSRDISKFYVDYCSIKHSFVVGLVGNSFMGNTYLFTLYACSGVLIQFNFAITTASCYYRNEGTHNFELPQDITVIAGFEKKYVVKAGVMEAFPVITENGYSDDLVLLMLDKPFKPSPGVSIIKRASKGQADKCKYVNRFFGKFHFSDFFRHAELVSAVFDVEMKTGPQGLPKTVDVHVVCSPVKVIKQSVCSRLWSWIKPVLSLCGETKPRRWLVRKTVDSLVCEQAVGSPLVCDGALIGFQGTCTRNDEVHTSFIKIDGYLHVIDYVFLAYRLLKGKNKTTTGKPAANGADFFDETWWKMAAGIGTVLFVYF